MESSRLVSQEVGLTPTLVLEVLDHPVAQGVLLRRYEHLPYEDHDYLFAMVEAAREPFGVVVKLRDHLSTTSCFR